MRRMGLLSDAEHLATPEERLELTGDARPHLFAATRTDQNTICEMAPVFDLMRMRSCYECGVTKRILRVLECFILQSIRGPYRHSRDTVLINYFHQAPSSELRSAFRATTNIGTLHASAAISELWSKSCSHSPACSADTFNTEARSDARFGPAPSLPHSGVRSIHHGLHKRVLQARQCIV